MVDFFSEDILYRLKRLDEDASLSFDCQNRFRVIIVGGSGLVLLDTITRATHDIDVLEASQQIITLLDKYDMNCRVAAYMTNFPYNLEDRLVEVLRGERVDFYSASLEDIVISKLCSFRETDISDIENKKVVANLDWELLEKLATDENELKANVLNEAAYSSFKYNYEQYKTRFRP